MRKTKRQRNSGFALITSVVLLGVLGLPLVLLLQYAQSNRTSAAMKIVRNSPLHRTIRNYGTEQARMLQQQLIANCNNQPAANLPTCAKTYCPGTASNPTVTDSSGTHVLSVICASTPTAVNGIMDFIYKISLPTGRLVLTTNEYVTNPVTLATPPPTATITADGVSGGVTIRCATAATITWNSMTATSCTVSPTGWTGISGTQSTGNLSSQPTYTYTVNCTGTGGTTSASVSVTIYGWPTMCRWR